MPGGNVSFQRKVLPWKQNSFAISYPTPGLWNKSTVSLCPFQVMTDNCSLIYLNKLQKKMLKITMFQFKLTKTTIFQVYRPICSLGDTHLQNGILVLYEILHSYVSKNKIKNWGTYFPNAYSTGTKCPTQNVQKIENGYFYSILSKKLLKLAFTPNYTGIKVCQIQLQLL